ncbi:MAG: hypothetical protein ACI86H_001482 [bacterium]|jgi:hypothetical protein
MINQTDKFAQKHQKKFFFYKFSQNFLLIFCLLLFATNSFAFGSKCFWKRIGEVFVPGLGYAFSNQLDKAVLFGGSRWIWDHNASQAAESEYYEEDSDKIYVTTSKDDSTSGKEELDIYMNRETWDYQFYSRLSFNTAMISFWDMYEHDCKPNTDTYGKLFAPLRFDHFYNKWTFWLPVGVMLYSTQNFDSDLKITWHLGRGLSKSRLRNDGLPMNYSTGLGEEMLFRGTIQKSLFGHFKSWGWSPTTSRHSAIWLGAAIFGAAHTGDGFSANAQSAFLFGLYQGYVYQPNNEEFDLITAIAIHSWWNTLLFYAILNNSEVVETDQAVEVPLMFVHFRF